MPKGKKVEAEEPEAPVEEPKVAEPEVKEQVEATSKPEPQNPTGKFEKLLHEGKYYLVHTDGRILSPGVSEDEVDRMVMNLNNKRR